MCYNCFFLRGGPVIVKQFHLNRGVCISVWLVNSLLEKEADETQICAFLQNHGLLSFTNRKFYSRPQHVVVPIFPSSQWGARTRVWIHEAQSFPFLRKTTQSVVGDLTVSRQSLRPEPLRCLYQGLVTRQLQSLLFEKPWMRVLAQINF